MKRSSKPSGSTPGKPAGKANRREGGGQSNNLSSKRSLFNFKPDKDGHTLQPAVWSTEERRALVEYMALFSPVSEENECSLFKWPSGKDPIFWEKMCRCSGLHDWNAKKIR